MIQRIIIIFLIGFTLVSCQENERKGATLIQNKEIKPMTDHKKVIMIMIDSMTESHIVNGIEKGTLPAIKYLINNGKVYHDLLSPFPSMSVVIESTLVTGTSPSKHRIPGLIWYDRKNDKLIDYGSTIPRTWKIGTKNVLMNGLYHLNNDDLSKESETIYETLHKKGHTTGSVNMLVYRGHEIHHVTSPIFIKQLLHLPDHLEIKGPDLLTLGQVVQPKVIQNIKLKDGIVNSYGINDHYSATVTSTLIKKEEQPDFMMVFFPDFDKIAHKDGPNNNEDFANVDRGVQMILNAYESWDDALKKTIFIIIGDHGQDEIKETKSEALIDLPLLLDPYKVAPLLDEPSSGDIAIANNHRMAYVYGLNETINSTDIAALLSVDERIDHLSWMEGDELIIQQVGTPGSLRIQKNGRWTDQYEQTWSIEGNEQIASIQLNQERSTLDYNEYPDLFNQLYEALNSHSETMIVTAKPGHILKSEGAPSHINGGEHGGLHKNDTVTSLIISGTNNHPKKRRMKDLKEYFISLFE